MLADRVSAALARRSETRYSADTWLSDYLLPAMDQFGYGGAQYPFGLNLSQSGVQIHEISQSLPGYSAALRSCPPAFAAQMVRALVLSQARFTFRNRPSSRTPRRTFGTSALGPLEQPWTNATTGELLARMEWHAGLAGNAFVTNRTRGRLRVLRPDWVVIVYGSQQEPEQAAYALDGEVIGYVYAIGGLSAAGGMLAPLGGGRMSTLLPEEVAHWSPIPDPEASGIGMSWITPAVRDMQSDRAATEHKLRFWANGATPNLVVKGLTATTKTQFDEMVEMMEARHAGLGNAYKTLYLTAGADATVVGSNFKDMDLKNIQGASETRISSLSRVPASLLGIAEGLAGSSLNAGNFGMARRIFADTWVYPSLQDLAASLAPMVRVPSDAELWFDVADMPLLREDGKDAAEIEQIKATTITQYVREGFTADSAIAAVRGQDVSLLVHTNLVSVQLQAPGATPPSPGSGAPGAPAQGGVGEPVPFSTARSDEHVDALIEALAEFENRSAFNAAEHPRNPKGSPGGGRFRSLVDRVLGALDAWSKGDGPDDPFDGFDREQLRQVAKHRGITLRRGATRDEIAEALKADLKVKVRDAKAAKTPDVGKPVRFTLTGGSVDPAAKVREVEVENQIRAAYRDLARNPGSHVMIADLRERTPNVSRDEFDATLKRIAGGGQDATVHLAPQEDQKRLTPRLRNASVRFGDENNHMVAFEDSSPRPVPDSKLRNLDVGVFHENGKVSLWEVSDSGERRRRIAQADDLAGLEKWANDHGEAELADWARKERGGGQVPPKTAPDVPAKATKEAGAADVLGELESDLRKVPEGRRKTALGHPSPADQVKTYRERVESGELKPDAVGGLLQRLLFQNSDMGGIPDDLLFKRLGIESPIAPSDPRLAEAIRKAIAGLPREGAKPGAKAAPKTSQAKALSTDAAVREVEVENRVRAAYRAVLARHGGADGDPVSMRDLRAELGDLPRAEVDDTLRRMNRSGGGARIVPESNQKVLTPADHAAAIGVGPQQKHVLYIQDATPLPAKKASPVPSTVDLAHLRTLDRETARDQLDLLKVDQLKPLLREQGLPVSGKKRDLVDRLVDSVHGGGTSGAATPKSAAEILASLPADLTPAQKRARLRSRGIPKDQIEALVPLAPRKRVTATARSEDFDGEDLTRSDDDYDDEPSPLELEAMAEEDPTLDEIHAMAAEDAARTQLDHDELRLRGIVAERAAGHDVTPGHDELHHYWTRGEGLAKWIGSKTQFRTLRALLAKATKGKVSPDALDRFAASWVHEVTGFWPGSDMHRVLEGGKPRGHRIGPG